MSELCIANNCRSRLANMARRIFQALKMISSGDSSFFEIDTMTSDSVYYYEMFGISYIYITDMKYNAVPENLITDKPWAKDMNDVANLLAKSLARDCDFEMTEESRHSSLALYQQIHQTPEYLYSDGDLGVPPEITYSSKHHVSFEEKEVMLADSIYDFIVKCVDSPNQFSNPDEGLAHNFIKDLGKKNLIEDFIEPKRPSDVV